MYDWMKHHPPWHDLPSRALRLPLRLAARLIAGGSRIRARRGSGRGFRSGRSAFRLLALALVLVALLAVLLARTTGVGADATCSVPPVNLASAPSEDGAAVVLTWEASPDCTPDEYAVYRREMEVEGARMALLATVDGSTLTYTDEDVNLGEHYRYRIRSNDLGSRSGRTDITLPEATTPEPDAGAHARAS